VAEEEDRASKTEAPSQRRLDEARRKGDVARSPEVAASLSLAAALGVMAVGAGPFSRAVASGILPFIAHPDTFDLSAGGGGLALQQALRASAPGLVVLGAAAAAGVAGVLVQQGLLWSPSKLAPDASRVSPVEGFKRLFSLESVLQFAKALLKLLAVAACAWMVLRPHTAELKLLPSMELGALLPFSGRLLQALGFAVLTVMAVLAGADWLIARARFMSKMRMSREELKQDTKESDGDPHVKARQKQLRAERSKRRMMQAVPKATVVVMNPTHYAVALKYEQGVDAAPLCVAKGVDTLALKIRQVAEDAGVAVVEDPPLARALYAAIDVDETIPREHFEAVAKVIGFVFQRARARRAAPQRLPARPARA
jgi:flagellar biosynthesis protein FlhB